MSENVQIASDTVREVVRMLASGRSLQRVHELTGMPYKQVQEIAVDHGYPDLRKLRNALAALNVEEEPVELLTAQAVAEAFDVPQAALDGSAPYVPTPVDPLDADVRTCRECGCTDEAACEGGCWWVELDLGFDDEVDQISQAIAALALKVRDAGELREALEELKAAQERVDQLRARMAWVALRGIPAEPPSPTGNHVHGLAGDALVVQTPWGRLDHEVQVDDAVQGDVLDPGFTVVDDVEGGGQVALGPLDLKAVEPAVAPAPIAHPDDPDNHDLGRACQVCRRVFTPKRKDQKFCSTKCRMRFHNEAGRR